MSVNSKEQKMDMESFVADAPHTEIDNSAPFAGTEPAVVASAEPKVEDKVVTPPAEPTQSEPVKVAPPIAAKDSYLLNDQRSKQSVPVPVVAELRQKIRERDARMAELQQRVVELQKLQPVELDPLKGIEDDEPLTTGQLRALYAKQNEVARLRAETEVAQQKEQRQVEFSSFIKLSESNARTVHPDYDAVVGSAVDAGMVLDVDNQQALQSPDPAEFLYQRVLKKRAFFGVPSIVAPVTPAVPVPSAPVVATGDAPDDIFAGVFSPVG
jgi:hypothetical protein